MKKRILLSALLMSVLIIFCSCAQNTERDYSSYTNPEEAEYLSKSTEYIIHAAGRVGEGIAGYEFDGSNSMEGLENAYERGNRIIEMDFNFTSDGSLACIHDWYKQYSSAIEDNVPLSLDEFLACRIYDIYTPVWIGSLVEFMSEHEDVYIVTDIKDDNIAGLEAIKEYCPDILNRFIVQIYGADEYDEVKKLGYEYIIYTLYRLDWASKTDTRALKKFADTHELIAYTFSYELLDVDGYLDGMKKTGTSLFIHTVNDRNEQRAYFESGIDGIYTDNTLNYEDVN